jgi:hypothetical protein
MIPWSQLSPLLGALITDLAGLPAAATQARDEGASTSSSPGFSFPADDGGASIDYAIFSITPNGKAEIREVYDPTLVIPGDTSGPGGTPALGGIIQSANQNDEVVIEVSATLFGVSTPAWEALQTFKSKLALESVHARFAAMGLALWKSGPVNEIAGWVDGRRISKYVIELWCNSMSNASDAPITTIQQVNGTVAGQDFSAKLGG